MGQSADVLLHDDVYPLLDRLDIQGRLAAPLPSELKPYPRSEVALWLAGADSQGLGRRARGWIDRARFRLDEDYVTGGKRGLWNTFFTNGRDLYHHRDSTFSLYVSPLLYFGAGQDQPDGAEASNLYRNSRGLQLHGSLLGKVGFYADLVETQQRFPAFWRASIEQRGAIPGEGFWKTFKDDGYDFANFRGYLTYSPIRQLRIKFGRDRNLWGQGSQSLLLSDHATDYLFLQLSAQFWKLQYTTLWAEFVDFIPFKPDAAGPQPRKYAALRQLTFRPNRQLSFTLFESTLFAPQSNAGQRAFELQYLNPLILYRTVEQYIGSPDNTLLGLQWKWNFLRQFQFYGQLLLDDYNLGERENGPGWWGNKFGAQGGVKWIDAGGIETLDLQLEGNVIRPFTYTHFNLATTYSHYGQFLGHSLGTNLYDVNATVTYQPLPGVYTYLRYGYSTQGLNAAGVNTGGEVLNAQRPESLYNNTVAQGEELTLHHLQGRVTYQVGRQPLYVDAEVLYRQANDATATQAATLSLRYLLPWRATTW